MSKILQKSFYKDQNKKPKREISLVVVNSYARQPKMITNFIDKTKFESDKVNYIFKYWLFFLFMLSN